MEFVINGFKVKFDEEDVESARILRAFYEMANISREEFIESYEKCGSIGKVLRESVSDLKKIYSDVSEIVVTELNNRKVWGITKETFSEACFDRCNAFASEVDKVYNSYLEITNQKMMIEAQRQANKNSRGRVVGGGFGLGGAIKGMLIAGAINTVTGTIGSAFDMMDGASTNSTYNKKLNEIYRSNSIKISLANAVYSDIVEMFNIFNELLLSKYRQMTIKYDFSDVVQAEAIMDNILENKIPEEHLEEALVDMLIAFPALEDSYYFIYKICGTSEGELLKLADYFSIDLDLRAIEKGDNLLTETFGEDLDYIEQMLDGNEYFANLKYQVSEPIEEIIFNCLEIAKKRKLSSTYTSSIFEFKNYNNSVHLTKIKNNFNIEENEVPLLFFDTTIFTNGSAGVLVTNKSVYSSKENRRFRIDTINSIVNEGFYVKIDGVSIPEAYDKKDQAKLLNFIVQILKYKGINSGQHSLSNNQQKIPTFDVRNEITENKVIASNRELSESELCQFIEKNFFTDFKKDSSYGKYFFTNISVTSDSKKRLENALKVYANIVNGEKVLFWYDNTMIASGKEGFVITNQNIHFSNKYGSGKISWNDINNVEYKMILLLPNYIINNEIVIPCRFLDHDRLKSFVEVLPLMNEYISSNSLA